MVVAADQVVAPRAAVDLAEGVDLAEADRGVVCRQESPAVQGEMTMAVHGATACPAFPRSAGSRAAWICCRPRTNSPSWVRKCT